MVILRPVRLTERTPLVGGRYHLRLYGGSICIKRWLPREFQFSRIENALIEFWYEEVELPDPQDTKNIVESTLPAHLHPREKELISQGAYAGAAYISQLLNK